MIKLKLSYLIIIILIISIVLFTFTNKEYYTNLAPLPDLPPLSESELQSYQKKQPYGFNGNPFFERNFINNNQIELIRKQAYPYNGYKIPTKNNEYIPENTDQNILQEQVNFKGIGGNINLKQIDVESILQEQVNGNSNFKGIDGESTSIFNTFLDSFVNNNIGTISVIDNYHFNIKGNYGNGTNLSNFKVISGQNNFPGTISNLSSNLSSNNEQPTISYDNNLLPDTGYIKILIKKFVGYLNNNSNYNFLSDHHGDPEIINNVDNSIEFTIPFFIYEAKVNYTRGIIVTFHLIPNGQLKYNKPIYDIIILKIIQTPITPSISSLKLEPAQLYKSIFEEPIIDTNGYYQIFNHLGLMAPFETSPNTFTSDYYDLKGKSEGEKLSKLIFQEQINKFNATNS